LRGQPALLRQVSHFSGHDGEATAMLTRLRRFDARVDREHVGLVGKVADRVHEIRDLRNELEHGFGPSRSRDAFIASSASFAGGRGVRDLTCDL
jgi:hypothetical protein